MKVCGFTIVRNAVKYDYPIVEAIQSVLPLCDKFIVLLGNSEDNTLEVIQNIDSEKIEIHHSTWDESLRKGGKVLAVETNKAFDLIPKEYTWAFYIQADEVIHQKDYPNIKKALELYAEDAKVEGLLFKYLHFFGNYDYIADDRTWYKHEIRIVKNDKNIRSWKDAQGFRRLETKLNVKPVEATVHHYGWVKHPKTMNVKRQEVGKLWHDDQWIEKNFAKEELFSYESINSIDLYQGTHPEIMQKRIEQNNWKIKLNPQKKKFNLKTGFLYYFEKWTGYRLFEYKNYKIK